MKLFVFVKLLHLINFTKSKTHIAQGNIHSSFLEINKVSDVDVFA